MTVELWLGSEYEHTHEMEALAQFLRRMVSTYGEDETPYWVLANFLVNNCPLDLAVVKPNAFIVIELKEAGGRISGAENGPWLIDTGQRKVEMKGGSHGNPFLQVRDYRYAVIEFLTEHQSRFLRPRAGGPPALDHVSSIVAVSPTLVPGSNVQLPRTNWFRLTGLDELHLAVYQIRSPRLKFNREEMRRLVQEVLHLQKTDLARFTGSGTVSVVDQPPSVQAIEPRLAAPSPPPAPPRPAPELVASPAETSEAACIVCTLGNKACDRKALRGRILHLEPYDDTRYLVTLEIGELESVKLLLDDPGWSEIGRKLAAANAANPVGMRLHAFHLRQANDIWCADSDSLVVLEPDWLINVTALTHVDYCQRQLLLDRYVPSPANAATIRGNVVHQLLPHIWSRVDQAQLLNYQAEALEGQLTGMATAGVLPATVVSDARPHVEHLQLWAQRTAHNSEFRSETFVISPAVGMKGRVDALWERNGQPVVIGELKTSKSHGQKGQPGHVMQLVSYVLMLMARGEISFSDLHAVLLYSGNPPFNNAPNLLRSVPITLGDIKNCIRSRNDLVLVDYTGEARFEENPNKCTPCRYRLNCAMLGVLGDHRDPRMLTSTEIVASQPNAQFGPPEKGFFQHYARLLTAEMRAVKDLQANFWRLEAGQRAADGKALHVKPEPAAFQTEPNGNYRYILDPFDGRNTSELRKGDTVLISGAGGPTRDRVAVGTVAEAGAISIEVLLSDELHFQPEWLDAYTDEVLTERLYAGLFRWTTQAGRLRDVIVRGARPEFDAAPPPYHVPRTTTEPLELNPGQHEALNRSLMTRDYLLVLGPPGSGKTTLIQAMVRAHLALGRRILISASTNRAVDQALKKLLGTELEGEVLRLGNENTASPEVVHLTLASAMKRGRDTAARVEIGREALLHRSIVGATASTLLSGSYSSVLPKFDIAIIDEAAQMTVPATFGPVCLAERFVLIGDHNQLPPVVQSERRKRTQAGGDAPTAMEDGALGPLSQSLFDVLRQTNAMALVRLEDQYRMNAEICGIPSELWYEGALRPATPKVGGTRQALLGYSSEHPLSAILDPNQPVKFIDVPLDESCGPRTNRLEALWIKELVRAYQALGIPLATGLRADLGALAIIAPFRAQVALIRRELELAFPAEATAIQDLVDTVDRFQGSERDMVILSLSTSGPALHELLCDERRLNVGITRAKHKLIILGNYDLLRRDPTYYQLFAAMRETLPYPNWMVRLPLPDAP